MPSAPAKTENAGRGARLDSWKEIAAYLGKAERTVKRWEKERGLPAHRLPGSGNASVYAYTVELEQWLKSGTAPEPEASPECDADPRQDQLPSLRPARPSQTQRQRRPTPSRRRFAAAGFSGRWLLAFCGLLLAGIAGAAVNSPIFGQAASV